jgi:M6 family metalloprotease-like protein
MPVAFFGKEFTFEQPDGKKIRLLGWGNQNFAVFEDLKGYTVIKDPGTRFYQYARLSADKSRLEPSGKNVGSVDPDTLGLEKHLRIAKMARKMKAFMGIPEKGSKSRWQERREAAKAAKQLALKKRGASRAPPSEETKGDYVGLCLLIQFPDVPGTITKSDVNDFCNKRGYSDYGNKGSVYDYFYDVSGGRIRYSNIVTAYYTAKKPRAYYTDPAVEFSVMAMQLIEEALTGLKDGGFDPGQLSSDPENYVYAMNVFYAGTRTNNWSEGLWPHSWHLNSPFDLGKGKKVFDYQITDMGDELSLATFCHENGHMVCDFPDLYDYGYESCGVGAYCLMCSGGPDDKNPTQVCGYLKYKAGWGDKVTSVAAGDFTIKAGTNDFLLYSKDANEYFIIENRFRKDRDSALPASGLAIWHVDEMGNNDDEQMTPKKHYECSLEQADGRFDLERRINDGDAMDLFKSPATFGSVSEPDSRWWDGTPSGLEITGISKSGTEMSLTVVKEGSDRDIVLEDSPGLKIPDNDTAGITRTLKTTTAGKIRDLAVTLDISHKNIGDLTVTLTSPGKKKIELHVRFGGKEDNIRRTYTIADTPDLSKLIGKSFKGTWSLNVADHAKKYVGKLNSWELKITPK